MLGDQDEIFLKKHFELSLKSGRSCIQAYRFVVPAHWEAGMEDCKFAACLHYTRDVILINNSDKGICGVREPQSCGEQAWSKIEAEACTNLGNLVLS